ncbi:MAG: RimK family alpha-L-glutamate ligase [Methylococcaceae bacterium]
MNVARVAIFTDDPGWHGQQLKLAFNLRGYMAEYVSLTTCKLVTDGHSLPIMIPGFEDKLPTAVFVRGVPGGSLEEVVFFLDILHALKILGIPVYNDAYAIEKSVDKGMTSFLLQQAGLPTPVTWEMRGRDEALCVIENELHQGRMVISKPLFGSQGEGIRRIEKMTDLFWLTSSRGIYYLQRFVQCGGVGFSDVRVFVINGHVVASMRRKGISWLNNVARGASCESIAADADMARLAVLATQALQMDYAGVDIIQDQQGNYTIIEVNSIPAWKGLQSVCDLNLAQLMVDDLLLRYLGDANLSARMT